MSSIKRKKKSGYSNLNTVSRYLQGIDRIVTQKQNNPVDEFASTGRQSQEAMFYILALTATELAKEDGNGYDCV